MTPAPAANPASSSADQTRPPRLAQRRNAMANVMAGMSPEEINTIRVGAPASIDTSCLTCVSTTNPTSAPGRRTTSHSSLSDMESDGSTAELMMEGDASGSGLAALAYRTPNSTMTSPQQSPTTKHRRNGLADVLENVDQESLRRIRSQVNTDQRFSSSQEAEQIFCF